jgi:hypothetical protein
MNTVAVRWTMGLVAVVAGVGPWVTQAVGPIQYYALTPCRIVDTRNPSGTLGGPALADNQMRNVPVQGNCGVPIGAKAVSINVTTVDPSARGYLTLYPLGVAKPNTSWVNFNPVVPVIANGGIVQLGTVGGFVTDDLSVYAKVQTIAPAPAGKVHMVLDVTGYYQ